MRITEKRMRLALIAAVATGIGACSDDGTGPDPLLAPTDVTVTATAGGLEVSWSASTGAESYNVERQVVEEEEGFTAVASGVKETSYTDTGVEPGFTYQYRVRAVRGDEVSSPSDPTDHRIGLRAADLSGSITSDRTLRADTIYTLQGIVTVDSLVTLTIEPGTRILGSTEVTPSALIVRRGGKLIAEGAADAPIVFTSDRPAGSRARGDWGGVVLNGMSTCNFEADACVGEGSSGPYGGNVLDDDSGVLKYVRIEYAGYEVSFGNELNALTLNGVGSGTTIDYVQAHYGSDDGIEFFGGTVNVKHAIVTGASDDSFDYSTGWTGMGQFWIALQDPNDADNGCEVDNNEANPDAEPRTAPTLYNLTIVGKESGTGTEGESTRGMLLRLGTAGKIYNAIVLGAEFGLDIDDTATYAQCASDDLVVSNTIFFDNGTLLDGDVDDETVCTGLAAWEIRQEDPGLTDPYNWAAPDFRPASEAAALDGAATPPADAAGFFDTTATYLGAMAPEGTPWYEGWTTFARS